MPRIAREKVTASLWGLLVAALLTALIVVGSRNLDYFDVTLVGDTLAYGMPAFVLIIVLLRLCLLLNVELLRYPARLEHPHR